MRRNFFTLLGVAALLSGWGPAAIRADDRGIVLHNDRLTAEFDEYGLRRLSGPGLAEAVDLTGDAASIAMDGKTYLLAGAVPSDVKKRRTSVTYTHRVGGRTVQVVYELQPDWQFVSKRIRVDLPAGATCRMESVEVFGAQWQSPIAREYKASSGSGAVFLRLGEGNATAKTGAFLALQNPFLKWERKDDRVSMRYEPDMEWLAAYGPFESDRVCIGLFALRGTEFPARNLGEWKYMRDPAKAFDGLPTLDLGEFDAMTRCVEAFQLFRPDKSLRVHVPWCENDYQVDVATPAGRAEWKRIIDQCAAVGVDHTLFTPANGEVAPLKDNADAWGWENCLWLGLGQKIRKGEWNIEKDPIPASIREMLDYAKSKKVKLVAYAYPTLGWKQNPEWTAWCGGKTGGYVGADTGVRSFQDWFVDRLVAFQKRTGISGYSFDHWWIAYEPTKEGNKPTSKYAQWFGCRRILEELRRRIPDVVIDGRQQYQWFGAWTWLGGSYPHPTTNDEQPGSFENFPDLHFSRVSGNRQRWATWYFHMEQFTPWDLVPGYMTHQTPRNDEKGRCVRDRPFNVRDWDLLGWKYSVISSIGTAPFNHVVDLLPARDETEFAHFKPEDQRWLKGWMDWTDRNRGLLRKLRPIIGPPALGRVDGMAAIDGGRGVIFLFNPNYREIPAVFTLDGSIGLDEGEDFLLRERYPREGRLIGKPGDGWWHFGDEVRLLIKGPEARVYEIVPAADVKLPALLNVRGAADLKGDVLSLTGVEGPAGVLAEVSVLLPPRKKPASMAINGRKIESFLRRDGLVAATVTFAGNRIGHCPQIGAYDPDFAGRTFRAEFAVPPGVFKQLASRRAAWPVPYTEEDKRATWRASDRLLLFIQIADPSDKQDVGLTLDGSPAEVRKAYSDVYPLGRERTFTGYYVDVSNLPPGVSHRVEVSLPDGLQPGQFQGLFLENVEEEFTTEIR